MQLFADFIYDICQEILRSAEELRTNSSTYEDGGQNKCDHPHETKKSQLTNSAKERRRNGVYLANTEKSITLHFSVHPYIEQLTLPLEHCVLSGCSVNRQRSQFQCFTCSMHLCFRATRGSRKYCWKRWYESRRLK